ncbi:hypothetical protein HanXRQr2_Chr04g0151211 [Helianthus annuus]|uniref:Uncharacterized protein n=1 Tax=Helianthus annuus TaxID=4232 RepID=A0A9K3J5U1_HELAN|nr:hypothetical protein HanXRQr2_Chr04g0151211 [Helianthus annuus]KAJ0587365.1 hypothetical protein HanIR_Chr04g0162341 [Helianthus annuus]
MACLYGGVKLRGGGMAVVVTGEGCSSGGFRIFNLCSGGSEYFDILRERESM